MDLTGQDNLWLIVAGIGVFFVIRLAVGYLASRRVQTTADYVVAGRRLPVYLAGASIMATWFAAETIMGASSTAYELGLQGVVFDPFGAVLCLILSGLFFMRLMRRARYVTAMDFFEARYGRKMVIAGAFTQVLAYFGWTAAQIVAGGSIVQALFGVPLELGMVIVTAIVTSYTMMGGMWADTLLDFMQVFLTAGGITLIFVAVLRQVGGFGGLIESGGALYVSNPWTIMGIPGEGYLGYSGHMGAFYWLAAWMAVGLGSLPAQDLIQRSMSARSESVAVGSSYLAALLYGMFGILSPLIGIGMFALKPAAAEQAGEFLIISAAVDYLSPVLASLFIAALVSALMSTSDSSLLAGASIITENLMPAFGRPLDEKSQLRWTRIMVLAIGLMSLLIALFAATIYKLAIFAWTVLLVGQAAPFILGFYWKKANHSGALAGFGAGFISWLVALALYYPHTLAAVGDPEIALWDAAYISSVPAFLICVVVIVAVSWLTQQTDPPKVLTDVDGQPLDMRHPLGLPTRLAGLAGDRDQDGGGPDAQRRMSSRAERQASSEG
ncbi:MAG: sodium:solute symporter family protein [Anaerolineae bacterium]